MTEETENAGYEVHDRRPMPPREWAVMRWFTDGAIRLGLSANDISMLSMVFAAIGAGATAATGSAAGLSHRGLWLIGVIGVELRAFCNLLDGMVAVKTQTASPMGELYNEVPDRISDVLMFVGLGYAAGSVHEFADVAAAPTLGWIAATAAVMVAYVRAQSAVSGAGQDYRGIMSKPVRMQLVAIGCLFMALAPSEWRMAFWGPTEASNHKMTLQTWGVPQAVLVLISAGCTLTVAGRLVRAGRRLREGAA